ncbi:MAG: transcription-repair coupling factor [Clostridia bacterium]|nr:transcription-repair coupling factor [Clostridia bacterium]
MNCFTDLAKSIPEFRTLATTIHKGRLPVGATGLSYVHKAHVITALCTGLGKKGLVLVPNEAQAVKMCEDLTSFGMNALLYPARDFSYRTDETVSRDYEHIRLKVLDKMFSGDYDTVVLSAEAAMQPAIPPQVLMNNSLSIAAGEDYDIGELTRILVSGGYTRCDQADGPGQFSVRGGILDFFPPDAKLPCRIEFWGDSVESIVSFDPDTQRRREALDSVRVTPAKEVVISDEALVAVIEKHIKEKRIRGDGYKMLAAQIQMINDGVKVACADKFIPLVYPDNKGIFAYAKDCFLFVCESFSFRDQFNSAVKLQQETVKSLFEDKVLCRGLDKFNLEPYELYKQYTDMGVIYLDNLPRGSFDTPVKDLVNFTARQLVPWNGSLEAITEDISNRKSRRDCTCVVFAGTEKSARTLSHDLEDEGIACTFFPKLPEKFPAGTVSVIPGGISYGMEYPGGSLAVFTYRAQTAVRSSPARRTSKNAFNSLSELHRGEYVVHSVHGIGIFEGINTIEASGTTKDYIKIRYDRGDILYVPVTQLDQVSRYIGAASDENKIKLNKLGGADWQKARNKVRKSVKDMAKDLIELYSKRMKIEGHAFSPDIDMQSDFERRFEYEETEDQLRCTDEIKKDMEKPYPMDRLLCGDVGFGKTEVALRAVFKCVADGKQAAILVPTTILALQHYQTILKRFEGFPIEVGMLSRFCTKAETDKTLLGLKRGSVDVVVGTHRLISKDVQFRDLGLIIVDEEQRFGVAQKEKLKTSFPSVDVLTLSATPIPRTLNMAMSGIRDMSVIEEAPLDRQPVQTYVMEYDFGLLVEAMEQELRRGGQVYYLYNNIENIARKASEIMNSIPDARVAVAHGKMTEDELSEVWRKLIDDEIDILVCTTIIETGVDVPNVNTLIIENAERMGLAQLHQIRGRVGRSARRASAYFTFVKGRQLSEIAERRLDAIREFTEFGSGFHIAMRDLELRGAGNVLGANQHGQMESVGYDMYIKLLEQAISEEKGEKAKEPERDCLVDLPIDAHIPEDYISSIPQRLQIYRRIADIRTGEDADDVMDELADRFGEPPESVIGLIKISTVRSKAAAQNIYEITLEGDRIIFKTEDMDMEAVYRVAPHYSGRFTVNAGGGKPYLVLRALKDENKLALIERVLDYMGDK